MKRQLLLLLTALLPLLANAYNAKIDGIYYNFSGDEATVTYQKYENYDYTSDYSGDVVIPSSVYYNGTTYSVTSIGDSAFENCTSLTSVIIGNSVTSIGDYAFSWCTNLTSITIPNSVTSIGKAAFFNCRHLTDVWCYAENVPETNSSAFFYSPITSATLHVPAASVEAYSTTAPWSEFGNIVAIDGIEPSPAIEFADANVKELCVDNWDANGDGELSEAEAALVTDLGEVFREKTNITSFNELQYFTGLRSIGGYAFYGCSGLTSVTIPNSVTNIGDGAFLDCSGLTSITIPNSVTSIGGAAFYDCSGLTSITIPNSVTTIGEYAFYGCSSLTSITLNCPYVGSWFGNLSSIREVTLGETVTQIENYAFKKCKLRNILIKRTVPPSINSDSFSEQILYHTVLYIPAGSWDAYAFDDGWYRFINIRETATTEEQVSMQQAYTLMDANSFTYSVYDPMNDCIGTISSAGINEDNPNHSWQVIETGGSHYLYNVGAKKFAVASNGSYTLSDEATPINMENGEKGIILGAQTNKQWALVCNESMSVDQSVITGISLTPALSNGEGEIYNLAGQRLNKMQKGINIVGGRKVLVK